MADKTELAERVRAACLAAALEAYEDAGISGLCAEGRWEYAMQAISTLDLEKVLHQADLSDIQLDERMEARKTRLRKSSN
ncbi:MAG: hypothetical protein V2J55_06040 [Candidatus Competibacteraceae bacterium]|jgi:hypothetical protein|nr:hypothetical protein [Candidatus Competibacteraceae bacterium]